MFCWWWGDGGLVGGSGGVVSWCGGGNGGVMGGCLLSGGVKDTLLGVLFNVLLISGESGSEKPNLISENLVTVF